MKIPGIDVYNMNFLHPILSRSTQANRLVKIFPKAAKQLIHAIYCPLFYLFHQVKVH